MPQKQKISQLEELTDGIKNANATFGVAAMMVATAFGLLPHGVEEKRPAVAMIEHGVTINPSADTGMNTTERRVHEEHDTHYHGSQVARRTQGRTGSI